jgi:mannose-6-phosphate isomerase
VPTRPEPVAANTFKTFYPGAGRIAAFRNDTALDPEHAEDWVGSITTRTGQAPLGLSRLADGTLLSERIAEDPATWVGPEETGDPADKAALLAKLLDAGARLPLHIHPDRAFAAEHLASRYGKSEAWLVLHADPDSSAHLGFARDVDADELTDWVTRQDVASLLDACHQVPISTGDVVFCPGGVPHAIGEGVLILEVQEPTDLSIMLEWEGHPLDPADSFLGLVPEVALGAVRRHGLKKDELQELSGRAIRTLATGATGVTALLPEAAEEFFVAEQVIADIGRGVELDRGFAVLVVNEGAGVLSADNCDPVDVVAGQTYVLPHALTRPTLHGGVSAVRCAAGRSQS